MQRDRVTAIGTGENTLNNDPLTLVAAGGQIYGIDTASVSGSELGIPIYTVDTTTGVATPTGVSVTGLHRGFTLDTATGALNAAIARHREPFRGRHEARLGSEEKRDVIRLTRACVFWARQHLVFCSVFN